MLRFARMLVLKMSLKSAWQTKAIIDGLASNDDISYGWVQAKLDANMRDAGKYEAILHNGPSGVNKYTVQHRDGNNANSYVVDVLTRVCTCGVPQHSGWPCTHVFAALQLAARPADAVLYDVKKCLFCQNCAAHVYLLQLPRTWIAPRGCASRI